MEKKFKKGTIRSCKNKDQTRHVEKGKSKSDGNQTGENEKHPWLLGEKRGTF